MSEISTQEILTSLPVLSYESQTSEFYIRLPTPFSRITLTPVRSSDAAPIVAIFNDSRVYQWTTGPPLPYLLQNAEHWLSKQDVEYEDMMKQVAEIIASGRQMVLGNTPFRSIRDTDANGSQTFIGDLGLYRCMFAEIEDPQSRAAKQEENARKELGNPTLVWMIGDYLAPSHHRRGIMTAAIRTLIYAWAVPYMGARIIRAYVLTGNTPSRSLFEKLGFKLIHTSEGGVPTQGKRDAEVGVWSLELVITGEA